ncbi:MAG: hypothetical protein HOY76_08455 [Streptomyces sp.]|nr:hypothetical protein [Streptomyces sp.]
MSKHLKLYALDVTTNLSTLGIAAASAWWFNSDPDFALIGSGDTAHVMSVALSATATGIWVSRSLRARLVGARSRLAAAAEAEPKREQKTFIPAYTIDWPVRPAGYQRITIVGAFSVPAAMRRATAPWRLRYLNWNLPAGKEIAYDLQPTVWRTDRHGTHHVGGPLYTAPGVDADQVSADYMRVWHTSARFRSINEFDIARSASIPVDDVRAYLAVEPADPAPRWTARDLIAFHTKNAENADGPDADAVVHEEMRQADKATNGRHPQIGRIKADQYR